MSQTQDFIRGLQLATRNAELPEFWEDYSDDSPCSFNEVLNKYADYYNSLKSSDEQNQLKSLFWKQIKAVGTPIIEDAPDNKSRVYFLLSRDNLKESAENPGQKRDVYLQGDFHGYGSTLKEEQLLEQFDNTDIMLHSDLMPKGSLVTYYYVQLEPSHGDKSAVHFYGDFAYQPPSFFPVTPEVQPENKPATKSKEEIAMVSNLFWGEDSVLVDEYCKFHKSYDQNSGFFYADSNKSLADLGFPVRVKGDNEFFSNFFANKVKSASLALASKNDKVVEYPEDQVDLDKCSRSILVFAPEDNKSIDNVVIMYDGRFYQLGNTQERLENIFDQNTLTIYVNPEKGIQEEAINSGVQFDVADSLPGMNERTVDLKHRVDEYAKFIHEELLPELVRRGFAIPDDPSKRVLVGSSLAGTASIYMGMKYPQWFGKVVAQSPSIANREKLEDFVVQGQKSPPPEIYLSCGEFECPEHARNLGLPFAKELEKKLNIKLRINPYGHQMEGWSPDLGTSLSALGVIAAPLANRDEDVETIPHYLVQQLESVQDEREIVPLETEQQDVKTLVNQYQSFIDQNKQDQQKQKAHVDIRHDTDKKRM